MFHHKVIIAIVLFEQYEAHQSSNKINNPHLPYSSHISVSLWSSYACLCVEDAAFDAFHAVLYDGLAKKDKTTVDEAIKVR